MVPFHTVATSLVSYALDKATTRAGIRKSPFPRALGPVGLNSLNNHHLKLAKHLCKIRFSHLPIQSHYKGQPHYLQVEKWFRILVRWINGLFGIKLVNWLKVFSWFLDRN